MSKDIAASPYEAIAALIAYAGEKVAGTCSDGSPIDWAAFAVEDLHSEDSEYVVTAESVGDYIDSGWAATWVGYCSGIKVTCVTKNRKDAAIVDLGDQRIVRLL